MRIFTGVRTEEGATVYLGQDYLDMKASQKIWNHSPDGAEWGYGGSGPAQLALAILMELLPVRIAVMRHQDFKRDVIARLDHRTWVLTQEEVYTWLKSHPLTSDEWLGLCGVWEPGIAHEQPIVPHSTQPD